MKNNIQLIRKAPWHLFLFSIYPILELWLLNIEQISADVIFRPLILALVGALLIWGAAFLLLKDGMRAAIISTIWIVAFFSYGHIYLMTKGFQIFNISIVRHRTLLIVWVILSLASFLWIKKTRRIGSIKSILNLISLLLVGLFFFELLYFQVAQLEISPHRSNPSNMTVTGGRSSMPDIYYIILDGYGRSDVLAQKMDYDNSAFISELESMGFYIARYSQSNYAHTTLSLASSLNFEYLDALGVIQEPNSTNRTEVYKVLKQNALRDFLEKQGYKTVAFATGFNWSQFTNSDYYLHPQPGARLNEFEYLLLQTTLFRVLLDSRALTLTDATSEQFRERTSFAFEKLKTLPSLKGPKFVFAHIIIPHPPFVFGPNGEAINTNYKPEDEFSLEEYNLGYKNQVTYANTQILDVVRVLIDESETPPIIIIQGDHGPGHQNSREVRMKILNAYYLPGHPEVLYDTISPINSFRIILNTYFDQSLPILEDKSYFSRYKSPYVFEEIENPYINR